MKSKKTGRQKRGKKTVTINLNETVTDAAVKMRAGQVGCLIVTDSVGKMAGIITERDVVKGLAHKTTNLDKAPVSEIMTRNVISVPRKTYYQQAREVMSEHHIRHLPIVKDGVAVGMFSIRDIMEQQLLQDRLAAEQVIMLSACLRSIDLEEVIHNITSEVPKLFGARSCTIYLLGGQNEPLVSYNRCLCTEEQLRNIEDKNLSDEKANVFDETPLVCQNLGAVNHRLIIPLNISGTKETQAKNNALKGYLCLCGIDTKTVANKELFKYKVKLVGELLNAHLSNAWRYQDARIASMTDTLTQVGSREFLEDKLESECARALRYNQKFSLAIIDLDNFKTINDSLGHSAGDDALRNLASCMKSQKRRSDILARFGGDEFVIIMPQTRAQQALIFIERLVREVHKIEVAENSFLTISCGVSENHPDDNESGRDILRRADSALYEAKRTGKDCAKVFGRDISVEDNKQVPSVVDSR
jgi:diguanylate cyclase (GGDEF)-like protein